MLAWTSCRAHTPSGQCHRQSARQRVRAEHRGERLPAERNYPATFTPDRRSSQQRTHARVRPRRHRREGRSYVAKGTAEWRARGGGGGGGDCFESVVAGS